MSWPSLVPLHKVASVDSGPAFKSAYFGERGEGIPLLRGDNIEPGAVRWTRTKTWPTELLEGYDHLALQADDLVLGMDRPVISSGLKLARVKNDDLPALLVQRVARIRPDGIDSRYLYHWLRSGDFVRHLQRTATGTQLPHVTLASIREFSVPRFDAETERRVVEILEGHLSRLEAASTQLSKAVRRADALVASSLAMHTTCAAESKVARSSTVGAEAVLTEYGTSAKCGVLQDKADVPIIRMGNLRDGELDWTNLKYLPVNHKQFPKLLLQHGDLLFNRTNSAELVGKAAVFDGASPSSFASYLIRVRFKDSVDPWWANMVINSPAGRRYVRSVVSQQVGQANVNGTKLKAFPLPLPGRDEQERRVAEHRDVVAARQRLRAEAGALLARSELLRRALLTAAFSGRLTRDRQHLDIEKLVSL